MVYIMSTCIESKKKTFPAVIALKILISLSLFNTVNHQQLLLHLSDSKTGLAHDRNIHYICCYQTQLDGPARCHAADF
jgi:hypothetical protein